MEEDSNVDMDRDDWKGDDNKDVDKLEEVGSGGPAGSPKSRSHPCRFCSESFSSELRLILHFREEHLDPEDTSSDSESDADANSRISSEDETGEGEDATATSMLDFVTDYERALLKGSVPSPEETVGPKPVVTEAHAMPRKPTKRATTNDKPQLSRRRLPNLRTPEKGAPTDARSTANEGQSPEVIIILPDKASKCGTGNGFPRKPALGATTKTSGKKVADKPKKAPPPSTKQEGNTFDCSFCGKSYTQYSFFCSHIRRHIQESPYFCKLCDESLTSAYYLTRHMQKCHSTVTPYKCKLCPEAFSTPKKLGNHMTIHSTEREFECEYCKMRFYWKSDLTKHIRSHTGERPFKCDHCKKGFTRRDHLGYHMRSFHNSNPSKTIRKSTKNPIILKDAVTKEEFRCSICDMKFERNYKLRIHMTNAHNQKNKKFECEHCKTRFTRNSEKNRHVRMFHSENPIGLPS